MVQLNASHEYLSKELSTYLGCLNKQGYFNGSILVAYQNKVLVKEGYGYANIEHGIYNNPSTKFRVGSLTKPFTAMAILQLEQEGLLSVQDKLSKYIPDYPSGDMISLHHMLTHTSGIPDFASSSDYWTKHMRLPSTLDQSIGLFKHKSLNFEPGSKFGYCNSSFTLLAYIINKVSGLSYEEYLNRYILKPLHMNNTYCDDSRKIIHHRAEGYTIWEDIIKAEFIDMTITEGAYCLCTTVEDLYLWDRALNAETLVGRNQLQKMFSNHNGVCGYDWFFEKQKIRDSIRNKTYRFGDVNGFINFFSRYIDEDLTIILLSNFNLTPVEKMSDDIAAFILEAVPLPIYCRERIALTAAASSFCGSYRADMNKTISVTQEKDRIFITMPKQYGAVYKYEIYPVKESADQVVLQAEHVNESIAFDLSSCRLQHTDASGRTTIATKIK